MKVRGVDHPLQHVLCALGALCGEERQTEVKRKEARRSVTKGRGAATQTACMENSAM